MSEQFVKLHSWMTELDLSGNELIVLAVIHSFTTHGRGYDGGLSGLAKWTGCTERGVFKVLTRLEERGLVSKAKPSKGRVSNLYLSMVNHEQSSRLENEQSSGLTMNKVHVNHEQSSYNKKDKKDIDTPLYPPKGGSENADAKPGERKRPPRRKPPRALDHIHGNCSFSDEELKRLGISTGQEFYDDYKDSLTELRLE